MSINTSGLLGTAVNLAVLGVGISLFAGAVDNAQRSLNQGGRRPRKRSNNDDYNILGYDNYQQPRKSQRRRRRDDDDIFAVNF